MQKSFNGLFTASHRPTPTPSSAARRSSRTPPAAAASRSPPRCSTRSGRCPRSRRPAATVSPTEANVADIIGTDGKAVAKESVGGSYDAANAALQPVQAQDRQAAARAPARSRSTPAPPTKKHYEVGDTVVVSTLGKQAHATGSPARSRSASVDSLGFASIAAWDVKTAQTLLDREGRYDAISVAAKNGTSPAQLVQRDQAARCPPTSGQGQRQAQAKDDAEEHQRRHGDDPLRPARLRRHRAARRRVRDLQHAVDHGRPAHARVRDAADARRLAQAGHALGRARGPRDRPRRLGDRARRWASGSPRAWSRCSSALGVELPEAGTVIATRTITVSLLVGTGGHAAGEHPAGAAGDARAADRGGPRGRDAAAQSRFAAHSAKTGLGVLVGVARGDRAGMFAGGVSAGSSRCCSASACSGCSWASRCWRRSLVKPLARVVGWPARRAGGVAGELAGANAVRNPGRTASTAAALMIGLTLVTVVAVLGAGITAGTKSAITEQVHADYVDRRQRRPAVPGRRGRQARGDPRREGRLARPLRRGDRAGQGEHDQRDRPRHDRALLHVQLDRRAPSARSAQLGDRRRARHQDATPRTST